MTKKYIHTDMGVFVEDDEAGAGRRPGRCPHCYKKQEQPASCRNTSELAEIAGAVADERTTRDDTQPMVIDFRVACGLLRRGYRRERR